MNESKTIGLTKLFMWGDPDRFQAWPKLLSMIESSDRFKALSEIAMRYLSDRRTSGRHVAQVDQIRGLPGLEVRKGNFILKGVGLLELQEDGYALSDVGLQLRASYLDSSNDREWIRLLAGIIIDREPRTRVFVKMLSEPDTVLRFDGDSWFGGSSTQFEIVSSESIVSPFAKGDNGVASVLRSNINDMAWWSLGEWRNCAALSGVDSCKYAGVRGGPFSLDGIAAKIRPALEVLFHLGVFRTSGSEAWIDHETAVSELGTHRGRDFGWTTDGEPASHDPIDILAGEIERLRTDSGYVVAAELRDALHAQGISNPDKRIGQWIREGLVRLEGQNYGQARHGQGLFDDPEKQLIRLVIAEQSLTHS